MASLKRDVAALGGVLKFSYQFDSSGNEIFDPNPVPGWIRALIGDNFFITPYSIDLSSKRFTDRDLEFLSRNGSAKNIRRLEFRTGPLSDTGLSIIAGLRKLYWLQIPYTQVTNSGIKTLCQQMPQLEYLDTLGSRVDDGVIDDLVKIPSLATVVMNLSKEGVAKLQSGLPKCKVYTSYEELLQ